MYASSGSNCFSIKGLADVCEYAFFTPIPVDLNYFAFVAGNEFAIRHIVYRQMNEYTANGLTRQQGSGGFS